MMKNNKVCLTCGIDITNKHKGAKYCGRKCYWKSKDPVLYEKRKKSAELGYIKHNKKNGVWNKGETKDTNKILKKMSVSRMGDKNPYSKAINDGRVEVYLKGKTYEEVFGTEKATEIKNRIRRTVSKQYKDGNTTKVNTEPEIKMKKLLEDSNIKYEQSFFLDNKIFDFLLLDYDIVIEVDGIYWHGKGLSMEEMNETQLKNHLNDIEKNRIIDNSRYKLIRVWEDEIDKFNIKEVISYE